MREITIEIPPDSWVHRRIIRLGVALPQTGEDAEDLGVPLGAERCVGKGELLAIEAIDIDGALEAILPQPPDERPKTE